MAETKAVAIDQSDRFTKPMKTYINDLEQILINDGAADPPLDAPCIKSKLLAALEFILVKEIGADYKYELVDDHGWPVSRIYDGGPKYFTIKKHKFRLTMFKDLESLYILFHFGPVSYKLIECCMDWVPCFNGDTENDMKRFESIRKSLTEQLFEEIQNDSPLFEVPKAEKNFINESFSCEVPCRKLLKAEPNVCYACIKMKKSNLNHLNHLDRLYITMIQSLCDNGCEKPNNENKSWSINLLEKYFGELIPVRFHRINFYLSMIEANDEFFFITRDFNRRFLFGRKVSLHQIPTFKNDVMFVYLDNMRLTHIHHYIYSLLLEVLRMVRPDLRAALDGDLAATIAARNTEEWIARHC